MSGIDKLYIRKELKNYPYEIEVRDCVTSTNSILKDAAKAGKKAFSVLIASSQTEGRGRVGRSFYSPDESGLYMSLLLRPEDGINPLRITTDAAVAVAIALEKLSGKETGIKWVNDIYINERKVCGILTEASFSGGGYVILGIGINVLEPAEGFPEDIKMRAGSVFSKNNKYLREKVAVQILKEINCKRSDEEVLEEYRNRSVVTGQKIDVIKNGTVERAVAMAINNDFSLLIKKEDGSIENLNSGDISIRI